MECKRDVKRKGISMKVNNETITKIKLAEIRIASPAVDGPITGVGSSVEINDWIDVLGCNERALKKVKAELYSILAHDIDFLADAFFALYACNVVTSEQRVCCTFNYYLDKDNKCTVELKEDDYTDVIAKMPSDNKKAFEAILRFYIITARTTCKHLENFLTFITSCDDQNEGMSTSEECLSGRTITR